MDTIACPHCGAPIKPTATFCLACDTPVVDTERGLSVAESTPVTMGRPLVGLAIATACVLALGAAVFGTIAYVHHRHTLTADAAAANVRHGLTLLVSAESGHARACRSAERVLAAPAATVLHECRQIVGHDSGAHLDSIHVDRPQLGTDSGTAHVTETVTDGSGTHTVHEVVNLLDQASPATSSGARPARVWRMGWDGRPVV